VSWELNQCPGCELYTDEGDFRFSRRCLRYRSVTYSAISITPQKTPNFQFMSCMCNITPPVWFLWHVFMLVTLSHSSRWWEIRSTDQRSCVFVSIATPTLKETGRFTEEEWRIWIQYWRSSIRNTLLTLQKNWK
jgi:hypothetical protein